MRKHRIENLGLAAIDCIPKFPVAASLPFFFLAAVFLLACGRKTEVKAPLPPSPGPAQSAAGTPPAPETPTYPPPIIPETDAKSRIPVLDIPRGPSIRIGLMTAAKEIRITAPGGFFVQERQADAVRQPVRGDLLIRVEQKGEEASAYYRVQVASFSKQAAAEDLCNQLSDKFRIPVIVNENESLRTYQVRVGEFATSAEARTFATGVLSSFQGAFVVRDAIVNTARKSTLALHGPGGLLRISSAGFLFFPASNMEHLRADAKSYRGILDVRLNNSGLLTLVNQVGMEEYLLGVVPAELSPTTFPEPAALAAQAIAARTYALKNMGRLRAEGYDLTADTRTQVYGGAAEENDLSNSAVASTYGLAIYYQDKLIDAMYTSTCGGKTENFSNVFDAPEVPYLKSVFCAIESDPEAEDGMMLTGSHKLQKMIVSDDGSFANRELELAAILGIIETEALTGEYLSGRPTGKEVADWLSEARKLAGKSTSSAETPARNSVAARAEFLKYAAESFFGAADIDRTVSAADIDYYLNNLKDGNAVPATARKALAYVIRTGQWRPFPDNSARPLEAVLRSDALSIILRWIESAQPSILRKGIFVGFASAASSEGESSMISLKGGNRIQDFLLAPNLSLFRLEQGRIMPVDRLQVIGNEKLNFHLAGDGKIDLLEVELNATGASSDRYSPAAAWDVTMTRTVLAEKLRPLAGNLGEIRDIQPAKLGESGRVVRIRVVGSRGAKELNGYQVRNALGLRDTLFAISRTSDPDGSISHFTFHGHGWGHGVGLCQVGAFGMARAGRSFEEILKTYYTGVEIHKAY